MIDLFVGLGLAWLLLRIAERLPERRLLKLRELRWARERSRR